MAKLFSEVDESAFVTNEHHTLNVLLFFRNSQGANCTLLDKAQEDRLTFNLVVKGLAAVWRYETFESLLPRKLNTRQNIAKDLKVNFT